MSEPHSSDCFCASCVDRLRHQHDELQAQVVGLLLHIGKLADELRALADRLSRPVTP